MVIGVQDLKIGYVFQFKAIEVDSQLVPFQASFLLQKIVQNMFKPEV